MVGRRGHKAERPARNKPVFTLEEPEEPPRRSQRSHSSVEAG